MGLLARLFLLWRLGRGDRRGSRGGPFAYGRPRRGRVRFVGPFPTYSTRTRRGSRVSVSGCCLPIPLALALGTATAVRVLLHR
jgi:hypothetical protein